MCDASDYTVEVILSQCKNKISHVIHYANKTLVESQLNYATTKKELLKVVFAFDKFKSNPIGSKVIVYIDYTT